LFFTRLWLPSLLSPTKSSRHYTKFPYLFARMHCDSSMSPMPCHSFQLGT
ncbi:hypothetical protein HOY82DRAFT_493929, partial [Tuber indicum]